MGPPLAPLHLTFDCAQCDGKKKSSRPPKKLKLSYATVFNVIRTTKMVIPEHYERLKRQYDVM